GISRIGHMGGGESALWVDEEFPDVFTQKAVEFMRANKDQPFFLFHSFHDIHVPRLPHPRFKNKTDMGDRGDVIVQMDWMIGEISKELEALGIAENTIVVFTSDNGPVLDDGYDDKAVELLGDHKPAGPLRGGKYSAFEAGTRVPTILSWPGTVAPRESAALVSQMDIYASMAKLVGVELEEGEARDSQAILDTLLGKSEQGRDYLLEESVGTLGLRAGQWKYIVPFPQDKELPNWLPNKKIEGGFSREHQLYNLAEDIGEQNNLAAEHPEKVSELNAKAKQIVADGYH
ncbi:MAG: sulfatase-like hydrolase/transferase, partial [Porticoccaceae bacterium]|nr:sulfatase-like hydrolase/transferase [Porticoccaceae bacterium]